MTRRGSLREPQCRVRSSAGVSCDAGERKVGLKLDGN